jgi:hypothetical protein
MQHSRMSTGMELHPLRAVRHAIRFGQRHAAAPYPVTRRKRRGNPVTDFNFTSTYAGRTHRRETGCGLL